MYFQLFIPRFNTLLLLLPLLTYPTYRGLFNTKSILVEKQCKIIKDFNQSF